MFTRLKAPQHPIWQNCGLSLLLLFCLFSFSCRAAESTANITVTATPRNPKGEISFPTGAYTFNYAVATVPSGAYSGIVIGFGQGKEDGDHWSLSFKLPAGKVFSVWEKDFVKGIYEYKTPPLPFVLTEKDFEGILSARIDKPVPAYIAVDRKGPQTAGKPSYIRCDQFTLKVTEFKIQNGKLFMTASFEGTNATHQQYYDANYQLKGEFKVANGDMTIMMVDD